MPSPIQPHHHLLHFLKQTSPLGVSNWFRSSSEKPVKPGALLPTPGCPHSLHRGQGLSTPTLPTAGHTGELQSSFLQRGKEIPGLNQPGLTRTTNPNLHARVSHGSSFSLSYNLPPFPSPLLPLHLLLLLARLPLSWHSRKREQDGLFLS